jgi:hypothetical protein
LENIDKKVENVYTNENETKSVVWFMAMLEEHIDVSDKHHRYLIEDIHVVLPLVS